MTRWTVPVSLGLLGSLGPMGLGAVGCDVSTPMRIASSGTSCPRVFAERLVQPADTSCFVGGCPVVVQQFGCQVEIMTDGCADAWSLRAQIDQAGNLAFESDELLTNCGVTFAPAGAEWSIGCERESARCQVDIYPVETPQAFDAEVFSLFDPPVDVQFQEDGVTDGYLGEGYLAGAATAGDRIWIASRSGEYVGSCNASGGGASELIAFDSFQGVVAGRMPAPACLRNLVSDPDSSEFLGLYADPPFWRVGRFEEGVVIQSSTVALFSTEQPRRIVVTPAGPFAVVANERRPPFSFVALIDRRTLEVQRRVSFMKRTSLLDPTPRPPFYLTAVAFRENVAVFNRLGQHVDLVNRTTGDLAQTFPLKVTARMVQNVVGYGTNVSDRLLVWSGFQRPTAMFVSEGNDVRSAVFYEGMAQNHASVVDPYEPPLVAVGLVMADRTARVARFDPEAPRFLPGSTPIGQGIVSDLLVGPRGALWAVLPDEGALVRLTERSN